MPQIAVCRCGGVHRQSRRCVRKRTDALGGSSIMCWSGVRAQWPLSRL